MQITYYKTNNILMNCEGFNELLLIVFFIKKCKETFGLTTNIKIEL